MTNRLLIALTSERPFKLAWLRAGHALNGHPFEKSTRLDKLHSEKHPATYGDRVFTVNVMQCNECGLTYLDSGLEYRK